MRILTGMAAHVLQRATGILLLAYFLLHVHTIHELRNGPAAFNASLATFRSPFFKLGEIALFGTVILHALNGVRITMLDLGVSNARQRVLFWGLAAGAGAVVFIAGAIPLLVHIF